MPSSRAIPATSIGSPKTKIIFAGSARYQAHGHSTAMTPQGSGRKGTRKCRSMNRSSGFHV